MVRLHLTYQHLDRDLALLLKKKLEQRNHHVSVDVDYLVVGQFWRQGLQEAFDSADGLVVLLTPNSVRDHTNVLSSQWMASDIGAALAVHKMVLPLAVGNVQFPALIDDIFTHRITNESELDQAVAKLDDAIRVHTERAKKDAALYLPSGYDSLTAAVRHFREDEPYETSVFVMMKFEDPALDLVHRNLLIDIWETARSVLASYGLKARRADKKKYHDQLWENVCVYMLGCRYGIAILEDRVATELNPNVTLEYGFMKALNRKVALFRDAQFKHDRADMTGKLVEPFQISAEGVLDKTSLQGALRNWLIDLGIPPVERV